MHADDKMLALKHFEVFSCFAVASEALLFPSFCKDKWHEMTAHGVCGI